MDNNTTLLIAAGLLGAGFLFFNNKTDASGLPTSPVTPPPVDIYNGQGVTIGDTFIPFNFLQANNYQFIAGNWMSPGAFAQWQVDNTPGAHWTTLVSDGLNTAVGLWNQFNGGGSNRLANTNDTVGSSHLVI